ncbi:MAG: oligosaccharide flippase family protein [Chloracidobacterium sp.]|nr:oligosaccharide flippase family protein [Chloracidobacterium sp.]
MLQNDIHNYFVGYKFTSAEYAIYAYGCFEVPLIAMLAESVTAVLIPRMNTLQVVGDKEEMIRLTARAMQKLAFFYFPIYAFLLITAQTFIITLFTTNYQQSASIFVINITILPFSILITDPIVRSYKELGRLFLVTRVAVLLTLVTVLYYGLEHFGLTGMITAAVGAIILEKIIAETMVIRKLGLGMHHLPLMTDVLKTAVICVAAGIVTYFVYENIKVVVETTGEHLAREIFSTQKLAILNFVGGSLVLFISAAVFAPIYLFLANLWGVIEEDEKQSVRALISRILSRRRAEPISQGDA